MHYSILIQSVAQLPLFSYLSERKGSTCSLGPLLKRYQSRSFVRKIHTSTLGGYSDPTHSSVYAEPALEVLFIRSMGSVSSL